MISVALDAMGGDNAPEEIVRPQYPRGPLIKGASNRLADTGCCFRGRYS